MFNKREKNVLFIPIYVIRDVVAEKYGIPIPLESEGLAKRQFCDYLAQPTVYPHRDEFVMIHVADYCSATATYYPIKENNRKTFCFVDVQAEVDRIRSEQGAAVGAEPPQDASSDL